MLYWSNGDVKYRDGRIYYEPIGGSIDITDIATSYELTYDKLKQITKYAYSQGYYPDTLTAIPEVSDWACFLKEVLGYLPTTRVHTRASHVIMFAAWYLVDLRDIHSPSVAISKIIKSVRDNFSLEASESGVMRFLSEYCSDTLISLECALDSECPVRGDFGPINYSANDLDKIVGLLKNDTDVFIPTGIRNTLQMSSRIHHTTDIGVKYLNALVSHYDGTRVNNLSVEFRDVMSALCLTYYQDNPFVVCSSSWSRYKLAQAGTESSAFSRVFVLSQICHSYVS